MPKHRNEDDYLHDVSNEDAESVVQRHPRNNFPFLMIIVIIIVFATLYYQSNNNDESVVSNSPEQKANQRNTKTTANSGSSNIHQLVSSGKIREISQQIASVDKKSIDGVVNGMTPIMLAASSGNVEIIDLLFTQGADPNKRGSSERTALQYATEKNHIGAAKRLLAYGANIDDYDNGRLTPLIMAANRGHTQLALFYIEKGADFNIQHVHGWSALIDAVIRNDLVLVNALVAAGADRELTMSNGSRTLDYARQKNYKEIVKILSN
jgi:ankyrin repeat protein